MGKGLMEPQPSRIKNRVVYSAVLVGFLLLYGFWILSDFKGIKVIRNWTPIKLMGISLIVGVLALGIEWGGSRWLGVLLGKPHATDSPGVRIPQAIVLIVLFLVLLSIPIALQW
jgi:hypothetical protein